MYCHAQTADGITHRVLYWPETLASGKRFIGGTACNLPFVWVNTTNVPKGTPFAAKTEDTITCLRCAR